MFKSEEKRIHTPPLFLGFENLKRKLSLVLYNPISARVTLETGTTLITLSDGLAIVGTDFQPLFARVGVLIVVCFCLTLTVKATRPSKTSTPSHEVTIL